MISPIEPSFDFLKGKPLSAQLSIIVCWWNDDCETVLDANRGVYLAPFLAIGRTSNFGQGDWFIFYDALGMFPHRDELLDRVYELASKGQAGELPEADTQCFDFELDEVWDTIYKMPEPE